MNKGNDQRVKHNSSGSNIIFHGLQDCCKQPSQNVNNVRFFPEVEMTPASEVAPLISSTSGFVDFDSVEKDTSPCGNTSLDAENSVPCKKIKKLRARHRKKKKESGSYDNSSEVIEEVASPLNLIEQNRTRNASLDKLVEKVIERKAVSGDQTSVKDVEDLITEKALSICSALDGNIKKSKGHRRKKRKGSCPDDNNFKAIEEVHGPFNLLEQNETTNAFSGKSVQTEFEREVVAGDVTSVKDAEDMILERASSSCSAFDHATCKRKKRIEIDNLKVTTTGEGMNKIGGGGIATDTVNEDCAANDLSLRKYSNPDGNVKKSKAHRRKKQKGSCPDDNNSKAIEEVHGPFNLVERNETTSASLGKSVQTEFEEVVAGDKTSVNDAEDMILERASSSCSAFDHATCKSKKIIEIDHLKDTTTGEGMNKTGGGGIVTDTVNEDCAANDLSVRKYSNPDGNIKKSKARRRRKRKGSCPVDNNTKAIEEVHGLFNLVKQNETTNASLGKSVQTEFEEVVAGDETSVKDAEDMILERASSSCSAFDHVTCKSKKRIEIDNLKDTTTGEGMSKIGGGGIVIDTVNEDFVANDLSVIKYLNPGGNIKKIKARRRRKRKGSCPDDKKSKAIEEVHGPFNLVEQNETTNVSLGKSVQTEFEREVVAGDETSVKDVEDMINLKDTTTGEGMNKIAGGGIMTNTVNEDCAANDLSVTNISEQNLGQAYLNLDEKIEKRRANRKKKRKMSGVDDNSLKAMEVTSPLKLVELNRMGCASLDMSVEKEFERQVVAGDGTSVKDVKDVILQKASSSSAPDHATCKSKKRIRNDSLKATSSGEGMNKISIYFSNETVNDDSAAIDLSVRDIQEQNLGQAYSNNYVNATKSKARHRKKRKVSGPDDNSLNGREEITSPLNLVEQNGTRSTSLDMQVEKEFERKLAAGDVKLVKDTEDMILEKASSSSALDHATCKSKKGVEIDCLKDTTSGESMNKVPRDVKVKTVTEDIATNDFSVIDIRVQNLLKADLNPDENIKKCEAHHRKMRKESGADDNSLKASKEVDLSQLLDMDGHILQMMHGFPERACTTFSRKKLLVLDVNGLLADIVLLPNPSYHADAVISKKSVFKRPFFDDFLEFCFGRFNVGIWSSRTKKNLKFFVDFLLRETKHRLLFCWDQQHCTKTGFKTIENRDKPLVLKELKKLWEKHYGNLPFERGEFNESNTLLLDDSPYKAICNPPHTAIFPYSYQYQDLNDNSLGPGGDLRVYLEGLASAENVQKYVEQNPFGQQPITERSASWPFYHKIIESTKRKHNNGKQHSSASSGEIKSTKITESCLK